MNRFVRGTAAATLMLGIAGCGSSSSSSSSSSSTSTASSSAAMSTTSAASSAAPGAALSVGSGPLGSVVAGPDGRTVYQFDKDTQNSGKSACTAACLTAWPPATVSTAGTPKVDGVTGKVGTIKTADGKQQLTLNGWPLYYFAGDKAAGDTNGQGVQGIWWVVTSSGSKVTSTAGGGAY